MRFALVSETREWSEPGIAPANGSAVHPEDIEAEARRRKRALRLDEWQMREYVTGDPMPLRIRHLCQQIDFAAEALARMASIPNDFRDDIYWPPCG